ncbi:hypothetical protein [Streptacidiphilus rugosus]|uniref:hypothetical protein n=1 Tax=Streptacidiphilus rugosus TaxID=405783 RepID=UPI000A94F275|nr:hypothetical protein [Streptacidiphilus rugosus]
MQRMIDVSDEVRAEIGDDEADRLLQGATAPDRYDCTSCRAPGDVTQDPTATVLFVGEETAVLAFAHSRCIPSQVVEVAEEQLQGAVRSISAAMAAPAEPVPMPAPAPVPMPTGGGQTAPAVLGVTCGLVLCQQGPFPGTPRAALVVEPTGPVGRPGTTVGEDAFVELLQEHGFQLIADVDRPPAQLRGWSVLMAMGQLHAVLQPAQGGGTNAWWQAHAPLQVTDAWRSAASQQAEVIMYAAPAGSIGRQPREDLLRHALDGAARRGLLLGAVLPLAGT